MSAGPVAVAVAVAVACLQYCEVSFLADGTSIAGFLVKKSAGLSWIVWTSTGLRQMSAPPFSMAYNNNTATYITGKSSTRGLCVNPNVCQITTSSFSISSFLSTMSFTPPTSLLLWFVHTPAAQSSWSLYFVTQTYIIELYK